VGDSLDLRDGSPGLIFATRVHIQTDQNNSRENLIGGNLKGFLEGGDPLLISSGFTTGETSSVAQFEPGEIDSA